MSAFDEEDEKQDHPPPSPSPVLLPHFMLSQSMPYHSATVRTIACLNLDSVSPHSIYLTGSIDQSCKLYRRPEAASKYEFDKDITFHQGYVYYVAPRYLPSDNPGFLTAGQDSRCYAIDHQGNPIACFEKGHEGPISCAIQHPLLGMIITGGWDGTASLWDFEKQQVVHKFEGHTYAVTCTCLQSGLIVTGAQDQTIKFWDPASGKCEREIKKAHGHIIRQFASLSSGGFLSCSNDETIKRWTEDGSLIREFYGHQGFIFSITEGAPGTFVTGSEDKTVRIWDIESGNVEQIIHHPATVWNVRYDSKAKNLLTACEDYKFRVLTKNSDRVADEKELKEFEESGNQAVMGAQAMDVNSLPLASEMHRHPGGKNGQIKVFNNKGVPCAYEWQAANRQWKLIGEVVTQQGAAGAGAGDGIGMQGRVYDGDKYFQKGEYDHIFDVDIGNNVYKPLPFNDGANPLEAAEKFVQREHLYKGVIDQIIKFINDNSKKTPNPFRTKIQKKEASAPTVKKLPMKQCVFFEAVKVDPPITKIKQLNSEVHNALTQVQIDQHLVTLQEMLKNEAFWYKSKFNEHHVTLIKKLLHWPVASRFPCLDLFRIVILHPDGPKFFKVVEHAVERLMELLSVVIDKESPDAAVMLALQCISNMFKWPAGEFVLRRKRERTLGEVCQWLTHKNKNIRKAAATIALNYSVVVIGETDPEAKEEGLMQLLTALTNEESLTVSKQAKDWPTLHRELTALGNVLVSGEKGTLNEELVGFAKDLGVKNTVSGISIPASQALAKEMQDSLMSIL